LRKTFRATEEFLNAGIFECRHAVHRILQYRLKMVEVARNLVETEILGDAIHTPG
jgi:hypothetical protein